MTSLAADTTSRRGGTDRSWSDDLLEFLARGHLRACVALLLFSLACFLPGFVSLQPMDRDEPRFAQASKQMLESGDFVDIRFQGEARHKKPVGIYWLQSGTVAVAEALGVRDARTTMAVYRLPSLLGALATVLLTYWAALAFTTRRLAIVAAAVMAASIILMVEARLAKTDAMLAACTTAALGGLARAYFGRASGRLSARTITIFWVAVALGVLIKGPLIAFFAGLPMLVLSWRERSARWLLALRPGWGLLLTLAVVAPWFIAIAIKTGGAFFEASVGHDMLGKVGTAQKYHWAPPGFYFVAFYATFWPAAALAGIAAPIVWQGRRYDPYAFALAWIVPAWLVLEIVPTKLPHYVMPLYPAFAIATVVAIAREELGPHRWGSRLGAALIPFIPLGLGIGLVVATFMLEGTVPLAALPLLALASLVAVLSWLSFCRGDVVRSALLGVGASVVLASAVFGLVQPVLQSLKLSPRLAAAVGAIGCEAPQVGTLGYREPSLVFLVGTDLAMLDGGDDAASFLSSGGCRVALVESRFEPEFQAALARAGLRPDLSTRVAGFNINGGRRLDIGAYVVKP